MKSLVKTCIEFNINKMTNKTVVKAKEIKLSIKIVQNAKSMNDKSNNCRNIKNNTRLKMQLRAFCIRFSYQYKKKKDYKKFSILNVRSRLSSIILELIELELKKIKITVVNK